MPSTGYTSLAVAALQAQAREIDALKRELASVRRRLEAFTSARSASRK